MERIRGMRNEGRHSHGVCQLLSPSRIKGGLLSSPDGGGIENDLQQGGMVAQRAWNRSHYPHYLRLARADSFNSAEEAFIYCSDVFVALMKT